MTNIIELRNLSKIYCSKAGTISALSNINLCIPAGKIFSIIGRSGAGKSTLVRCMNLLEKPTEGEVIIDQQDLLRLNKSQLRKARHSIGMVFQHFNLLSARTVFQNIAFPLELMKRSSHTSEKKVNELLELIDLSDKAHHYPSQLSGGQKQRVAIARALSTDPKILLCDEMTSALDPETTASILELIDSINKTLGLTVVLITHEMDVVKAIADRVAVLDDGKIVEESSVFELFKSPKTKVSQKLLNKALKLDLPKHIKEQLKTDDTHGGHPVFRIRFYGDVASKPIIDELIKHFSVEVNILQGNLEYLHTNLIGILVISITAKKDDLRRVEDYFKIRDIQVEMLGYINMN